MSFVRIWVHIVFGTKYRAPVLHSSLRTQLFEHIRQNAQEKDIWLDRVNGYTDHVHCLISLGPTQMISKVVQSIKGESSLWINQNMFSDQPFQWQTDYWAVSVSESQLNKIRRYIDCQEQHHRENNIAEEWEKKNRAKV